MSRKTHYFALILLTLASASWAMSQEGAGSTTPTQPGQANASTQPQTADKSTSLKDAKKKGNRGDDSVFTEQVANAVLNDIRDGLEAHSPKRMLAAFDANKMDGYLTFEDQVHAYFDRYEGFRVYFRIVQTTTEGPKGLVLAEFTVEATSGGAGAPQRSSNQIRFELERGKQGWKITDFRPRGFFS